MNPLLLYFLLLKATCTSFSGLSSLPVIQADLVEKYHVLTDAQLNAAVTAGRSGPGPIGLYVVCAGYLAGGIPGAFAGFLAMNTPAFLIIVFLRWIGVRATHPTVQRVTRSVILAAAGLLIATTITLARSAVTDGFATAVAVIAFGLLAFTRVDSLWIMLASAAAGFARIRLGG